MKQAPAAASLVKPASHAGSKRSAKSLLPPPSALTKRSLARPATTGTKRTAGIASSAGRTASRCRTVATSRATQHTAGRATHKRKDGRSRSAKESSSGGMQLNAKGLAAAASSLAQPKLRSGKVPRDRRMMKPAARTKTTAPPFHTFVEKPLQRVWHCTVPGCNFAITQARASTEVKFNNMYFSKKRNVHIHTAHKDKAIELRACTRAPASYLFAQHAPEDVGWQCPCCALSISNGAMLSMSGSMRKLIVNKHWKLAHPEVPRAQWRTSLWKVFWMPEKRRARAVQNLNASVARSKIVAPEANHDLVPVMQPRFRKDLKQHTLDRSWWCRTCCREGRTNSAAGSNNPLLHQCSTPWNAKMVYHRSRRIATLRKDAQHPPQFGAAWSEAQLQKFYEDAAHRMAMLPSSAEDTLKEKLKFADGQSWRCIRKK